VLKKPGGEIHLAIFLVDWLTKARYNASMFVGTIGTSNPKSTVRLCVDAPIF